VKGTEERRYEGRTTVPDVEEEEPQYIFQPSMVMDEESCSAYIYLAPLKTHRILRLSQSVSVDLDANGTIVGIELLHLFPAAIAELAKEG
jgi:uncharacterized protein YuzE